MTDLVDRLRKCSTAIYAACEQPVADDISPKLREAAAEIERLRKALREMVLVNAAFARTIVTAAATDDLKDELHAAGIADGFGARARAALGEATDE